MNFRKIRVEIIRKFILKNSVKGICYENVTGCSAQVKNLFFSEREASWGAAKIYVEYTRKLLIQ